MEEGKLGDEKQLDQGNLPTGVGVFNHSLHIRAEKIKTGVWKSNVSMAEVAKVVTCNVTRQWDKTDITHTLKGKDGVRKVVTLLTKCKELKKEKWRVKGRSKSNFGEEVKHLFYMSVCHHTSQSI